MYIIYIYMALRGWRSTVEFILFETSNSMKPKPSVFHTRTSKLKPVKGFLEPTNLDEVSNRILPTSHFMSATHSNVSTPGWSLQSRRGARRARLYSCYYSLCLSLSLLLIHSCCLVRLRVSFAHDLRRRARLAGSAPREEYQRERSAPTRVERVGYLSIAKRRGTLIHWPQKGNRKRGSNHEIT